MYGFEKVVLFLICVFWYKTLIETQNINTNGLDFQTHFCHRRCVRGDHRTCHYTLTLEHFFTVMPDCLDCLKGNASDCFRPRCIPADARQRIVNIYNQQLPGPSIEVCEGDELVVEVVNRIGPETTSVHWHGLHQRDTPWMDGVPMITQCPITSKFTYKFLASPPGTHFYHSHSGHQKNDGAFGPLIIRQPFEKQAHYYDHDISEHVIIIADWYNISANHQYYNIYRNGELPSPTRKNVVSILVNGIAADPSNKLPLSRFKVKGGRSYRFRIIHAGAVDCPITITIENHKLDIISSDGEDVRRLRVDRLIMGNADRFDFILNANQNPAHYAMTFVGSLFCAGLKTTAILEYESEIRQRKVIRYKDEKLIDLNCYQPSNNTICIDVKDLRSVKRTESVIHREPCLQYFVAFGNHPPTKKEFQSPMNNMLLGMYINNISYVPASKPMILVPEEINGCNYENPQNFKDGFCECTHVLEIKEQNCAVELVFYDEGLPDGIIHTSHLHGYSFHVIDQGYLKEPVTRRSFRLADKNGEIFRNFRNPPLKDTVLIPDGGYVVVRFIPNNPGFWFLHCHVDFHLQLGMAMVLKVGDGRIQVPRGFPKCY